MKRVLIIRPGYRCDLGGAISREVSVESVVRATAALRAFDGDDVTWVTSRGALPLVTGVPGVRRALAYDATVSLTLATESFDAVVNLEPSWEFCALAESAGAAERFGFTLDADAAKVIAMPGAEALLAWELSVTARRRETRPYPQILFSALGREWRSEPFVVARPASGEVYDVGFNLAPDAGDVTAWAPDLWGQLGDLLSGRYSISCGFDGGALKDHLEWIQSCRIVVSTDVLGLYLALALGKKVVALFGATSSAHVPLFGRGIALTPSVQLNCIPCHEDECRFEKPCVRTIPPKQVAEAVDSLHRADVAAR